jgi:hypothetical protein
MRLAILLACALSFSACSESFPADTDYAAPDLNGSLRIPLLVEDAQGDTYRLRGADFAISGSAMLAVSDSSGVRARESLVTRLPAGGYTVYLQPGWRLMQRHIDGTETELTAELISANPVVLHVDELSDESVRFTFRHQGKDLTLGSAGVRVTRAEPLATSNTL